jgi:hypothetical protein
VDGRVDYVELSLIRGYHGDELILDEEFECLKYICTHNPDFLHNVLGFLSTMTTDGETMRSMYRCGMVAMLLTSCATALYAQDGPDTSLTDAEKLYGLSLVWKEADYNFPLFAKVPALDWDSAYQAFVPLVLEAETTVEYYRVLIRFAALLQDGHTQVMMPSWVFQQHVFDQPKIRVTPAEGRALVWNVEEPLASQVPVGSEILAVDGTPIEEYLEREVYPLMGWQSVRFRRSFAMTGWYPNGIGLLWGLSGTQVALTVRTPTGEERTVTATRDSFSRRSPWVRDFPSNDPFEFRWLDHDVAYVALNTFGDRAVEAQFDSIAPELHRAAGVIVDVRRNSGGSNGIPRRITARHLTSDTLVGSRWRTRISNAAHRAWGRWEDEYKPFYTGDAWHEADPVVVLPDLSVPKLDVPIVVLIGRNTGSAAEDFLVWLDGMENVTLVGEPTAGSTGQPLHIDLPGGGSARILTKHDTYPDGREFLGVGVQPDVFVARTVEDVIDERDGMLERALVELRDRVR